MKKVYFLGAGATKADFPGAPLNDALLKEAMDLGSPKVARAREVLMQFLRIFFPGFSLGKLPRVEDVLTFLDSNLLNQRFSCKGYGYDEFSRVRAALIYLIGQVFEDKLKKDSKGVTERFVNILGDEDVIVSTNYDIVVDNVLKENRHNINYGELIRDRGTFSETYTLFGNEETAIRFEKGGAHEDVNVGKVELLKIHGSLNFLYCPKCKEVDITIGQKGILYCMRKNFEVRCINRNCTGKYEDLTVTPTYYKSYDNPFLKGIWRRVEQAISCAEQVIFVGYSLPEADMEIKCLLLRGIARNARCPEISAVDLDKSGKIERRYEELFGKVKYFDEGFEKYLAY